MKKIEKKRYFPKETQAVSNRKTPIFLDSARFSGEFTEHSFNLNFFGGKFDFFQKRRKFARIRKNPSEFFGLIKRPLSLRLQEKYLHCKAQGGR